MHSTLSKIKAGKVWAFFHPTKEEQFHPIQSQSYHHTPHVLTKVRNSDKPTKFRISATPIDIFLSLDCLQWSTSFLTIPLRWSASSLSYRSSVTFFYWPWLLCEWLTWTSYRQAMDMSSNLLGGAVLLPLLGQLFPPFLYLLSKLPPSSNFFSNQYWSHNVMATPTRSSSIDTDAIHKQII